MPSATEPRRARACDACHESKVRCDGNAQCALCIKRNIACTYRRPTLANRSSRRPSSRHEGVVSQPSVAEVLSLEADDLPPDLDAEAHFLHGAAATAMDDISAMATADDVYQSCGKRGFQIMLDCMRSPAHISSHVGFPTSLHSVQIWWDLCYESYCADFHNHWPVLHAPSWTESEHSILLEASVAVVATWSRDGPESVLSHTALKVHERIVDLAIWQLSSEDSQSSTQKNGHWAYDTWVVALLNVIFALSTGVS